MIEEITKKHMDKAKFKRLNYQGEPKKYPEFYAKPVKVTGSSFYFEFLDMEYYDYELICGDEEEIILLNKSFKLKNKEEKESFDSWVSNHTDLNPKIVFSKLRRYITSNMPKKEKSTKTLLETKDVTNIELVRALSDDFRQNGFKFTGTQYVYPNSLNISRPVNNSDIIGIVKEAYQTPIHTDTIKKMKGYFGEITEPTYHCIGLDNGYYDFRTGEFHEESPEPLIVNKYCPYEYDASKLFEETPEILNNWVESSIDGEIKEALQIWGYFLDDGNPYQQLFMLVGEGRNGKGVFQDIAIELNKKNVCNVDIFDKNIMNSKYTAPLSSAWLNSINESKLTSIEFAKTYLGGDGLSLSGVYQDERHYPDEALAKTMMGTNSFGSLKELDTAMYERMLLFKEFTHIIPREDRIPNLSKKITEDRETMNWILTNSVEEYSKILGITDFGWYHPINELQSLLLKYKTPLQHHLREHYIISDFGYDEKLTYEDIKNDLEPEFPPIVGYSSQKIHYNLISALDIEDGKLDTYKDNGTTIIRGLKRRR